ncbi:MAG TPA: winged helix-turn-helix transcriptional regulator [Candidatus Bilamarchaeum sp.]|nr:winged helix-turn-helix transcriptional regulator [Candidatus Bilamarchaeum sp.]
MDAFSGDIEKILQLKSRRKIFEAVEKHAGSHFREIERRSGLPTGTVRHHLSYLAKHGLISEQKDGNNVRYYPRAFDPGKKKLIGLLRQKTLRAIILTLLIHDNCNNDLLARKAGISPSTATWHMKKLEERGIIKSRREGRKTFYRLVPEKDAIIGLLIAYRESFLDSLVNNVIEMWG